MLRLNEKALRALTQGCSRDNKGLRKPINFNCVRVAENETQSQVIQNLKTKDFYSCGKVVMFVGVRLMQNLN